MTDQYETFCDLIREHRKAMFRVARSILRSDADAEDAVGEATVKAYISFGRLRKLGSFKLWSAVGQLGDEFRAVTVLFYYEDLSIREIGRILRIPVGTVNSRLSRAREKLRAILTD